MVTIQGTDNQGNCRKAKWEERIWRCLVDTVSRICSLSDVIWRMMRKHQECLPNPLMLFVEMLVGKATVENSTKVPQKPKNRVTI